MIASLSPAPRNDQPASETGASLVFHSSSHSSEAERDEPAQATSPRMTSEVGARGVVEVAACAMSEPRGEVATILETRVQQISRASVRFLDIEVGFF